jgi:NADH:ubiquinone oxidoreductase subunit K
MIGLQHYLTLSGILFAMSIAGIFINRRNLIVLLMCIELMLLSVNFNFIAFSRSGIRFLHIDGCRGRSGNRPGNPGCTFP